MAQEKEAAWKAAAEAEAAAAQREAELQAAMQREAELAEQARVQAVLEEERAAAAAAAAAVAAAEAKAAAEEEERQAAIRCVCVLGALCSHVYVCVLISLLPDALMIWCRPPLPLHSFPCCSSPFCMQGCQAAASTGVLTKVGSRVG